MVVSRSRTVHPQSITLMLYGTVLKGSDTVHHHSLDIHGLIIYVPFSPYLSPLHLHLCTFPCLFRSQEQEWSISSYPSTLPIAASTSTCYIGCDLEIKKVKKGKGFYGQEPPSGESTTTECRVNYQLPEVSSPMGNSKLQSTTTSYGQWRQRL